MKNKNLKIGVIAVLSTVATAQSCGSRSQKTEQTEDVKIEDDSLRLEQRLIELSKTDYVGELAMGAMCYESVIYRYIDYICPYCKDTIRGSSWDLNNRDAIESIFDKIKAEGYDVVLDKTEFCPHCSGKSIDRPEYIFKMRFSSNADYHIARSNIASDYQCVLDFILGNEIFQRENESESAIHDNIDIIQKMTGLGKDLKIKR